MKNHHHRTYISLTFIILTIEILIAVFVHDRFIRPIGGDILAVMLVYCFIRIFWKNSIVMPALVSLSFAFCIEFLQLINVQDLPGILQNKIIRIIIGSTFDYVDLAAYTAGTVLVMALDFLHVKSNKKQAAL